MRNPFERFRPVKSEDIKTYLEETRGLERDFIDEIQKSKRTAWRVAGCAGVFGFFCLLTLLVHIKETSRPIPPTVLKMDNATGVTEMLSVVKDLQETYGDVVDKYWISEYVKHRETYYYQTIQDDYDAVGLMSEETVAREYRTTYTGNNARDKTLADKAYIRVQLESPPVINRDTRVATTRLTTTLHWKSGQQEDDVKHWVATLSYEYLTAPMSVKDRLVNPQGFRVTSYRLDPQLFNQQR